jgi:hypothetical protein
MYTQLVLDFEKLGLDRNIPVGESELCKTRAIDWLEHRFLSSEKTTALIYYLKSNNTFLKRAYSYLEKGKALFYFKVFDAITSRIYRKKIALVFQPRQKPRSRSFRNGFKLFSK